MDTNRYRECSSHGRSCACSGRHQAQVTDRGCGVLARGAGQQAGPAQGGDLQHDQPQDPRGQRGQVLHRAHQHRAAVRHLPRRPPGLRPHQGRRGRVAGPRAGPPQDVAGQFPLELETKVHTKVRNHGEGPY